MRFTEEQLQWNGHTGEPPAFSEYTRTEWVAADAIHWTGEE